jgi:predicted RNA polymerase sigma factor
VQRAELSEEAIRLARIVRRSLPDDAEVTGLLALMLLLESRRAARTDEEGDLIPLPEQDRTRWDRPRIAEGLELLDEAIAGAPSASTSCRRRSQRCTAEPSARRTRTGRRSSRSTGCSSS